ncbi:MAG: Alkaline phosphatase synthesis sensor protein PhoR [Phycisphaerales bacterium]|nr:Alkaline phosphatase synthesis sensor protein PhoR [Phycisphaerales bacterium]
MPRPRTFYTLSLIALGCGAACAAAGAGGFDSPALRWGGDALLLGGGLGAAATIVLVRRGLGQLADAARKPGALVLAGRTVSPDTGFQFLTHATDALLESAERSVADARLQAKELEIQLKVATAERQHAEAILYSISDAVLVTDPFDELVLANESAARTFEFDLAKSGRSPVDQVLRDPKMIALIREMRQSHSRSGRRIVEHEVHGEAGSRTFKVTLSSISDGDVPGGVVAVLHDVTREREVSEMKNDFVSMVSHELRTPLASIRAYVEMLIDGEADDVKTQREFYEVIQNEANRLGRLIDNILNISRIESGLVRINKQPQSLSVIVKDAMEVIAPQARQKQIRISEELTPVFYQTMADRDMLYQAVLNLLSNAVKYTPVGGAITVEILVDEPQKKVLTRISDTGVGIPPKDLPFVFDKFYRSEANSRMAPGTGLGLSLVKHIVESVHQGRMFVESHVGKGSCFGFELDLCE